jgi:NAD(P)-dependent dehydrogenase (short-subunit alcohol dehydrogenase family)
MLSAMKSPLCIVTGASRGLGLAVARQLAARGQRVVTISRHRADSLPAAVTQWTFDLSDAAPAASHLSAWLGEQDAHAIASATLINNAGVVSQLAPLARIEAADLSNAIRVGLEAPLLLTSAFLRATASWTMPRKVVLVSSGLGRRAMAGSASYCAAKAGLDHLARALALEEAANDHGARIVSLAPGVIDTDMQVQLRDADPTLFPERSLFTALKEGGQLDSPTQAAARLLAYLDRTDFGANPVADVRDA